MTDQLTLSYSSLETFHTCERKFQFRKLSPESASVEREESAALSNGRAVDEGYGAYLLTRDLDYARFKTWLAYWPLLEDSVRSEAKAIAAMEALAAQTPEHWRIAHINGKPALQTSICIESDKFRYIGFIDAIVETETGIMPIEVKTTSLNASPAVLYGNSPQALVYAFCVYTAHDMLEFSFDYCYAVARMPRAKGQLPTAEFYTMRKSIRDVLQWLIALKIDLQRIEQCIDIGFFPKRNSCYSFGKECPFFSICDITDEVVINPASDLELDYVFKLDDLIECAIKLGGM